MAPWVLNGEDPPALLYWRDRLLLAESLEAQAEKWHREHPDWK